MKFEEILPFLKEGKMGHFHDEECVYLAICPIKLTLCWFNKNYSIEGVEFTGELGCLRDDWMIYEPDQEKCIKEKKLIDFSVNWYPTLDSMDRNEKEFIAEGWETFKRDSVDHNTGLMTHKLMMVKYEY
jgi:hypothetical protein